MELAVCFLFFFILYLYIFIFCFRPLHCTFMFFYFYELSFAQKISLFLPVLFFFFFFSSLIFPLNIYDGRAVNHTNSFNWMRIHPLIFDYRCKRAWKTNHITEEETARAPTRVKRWRKKNNTNKSRTTTFQPKLCKTLKFISFIWFIEVHSFTQCFAVVFNVDDDFMRFNPIGLIQLVLYHHLWFMRWDIPTLFSTISTGRSA